PATADLSVGDWHLVEAALTGAGTSAGSRMLWVDGALVANDGPFDFRGVEPFQLSLGAPWLGDRSLAGTLSFDDVRISAEPPASRLAVSSGELVEGVCGAIEVSLIASPQPTGAPAPSAAAPYDVEVA